MICKLGDPMSLRHPVPHTSASCMWYALRVIYSVLQCVAVCCSHIRRTKCHTALILCVSCMICVSFICTFNIRFNIRFKTRFYTHFIFTMYDMCAISVYVFTYSLTRFCFCVCELFIMYDMCVINVKRDHKYLHIYVYIFIWCINYQCIYTYIHICLFFLVYFTSTTLTSHMIPSFYTHTQIHAHLYTHTHTWLPRKKPREWFYKWRITNFMHTSPAHTHGKSNGWSAKYDCPATRVHWPF